MNYASLKGKTAFITGGARGIGKAAARGMAQNGARVAIADIDIAAAEATAEELRAAGMEAIALYCDVTDPQSAADMAAAVMKKWGRLDIAFNNAGICINTPALDMMHSEWNKVLDINLTGVFLTSQAAGRIMKELGGRFNHQYRINVGPYCQYSPASEHLQCFKGGCDSANQVVGS